MGGSGLRVVGVWEKVFSMRLFDLMPELRWKKTESSLENCAFY